MTATMTAPPTPSSRSCSARYATRRRPERETFGGELANIAELLGQPFMPWQRMVADVGCEIDPGTGLPAYREVVVTVPRQSGKTALFLAWQLHRCVSPRWRHPQRSAFTAQTGKDARDKWLDELFPLLRDSEIIRLIAHRRGGPAINEGMGNESVTFKTGSLIRLLSTSTSSGHSKTLHQAVMDEVWHDVDDRRQQGLRPAMITAADAQLLVCSTAGTDASLVLNRKVETGRQAVVDDVGHGVAYVEFSAPEGWDPEDEESYYSFMPALCPDPPCRCAPEGEGWRHTIGSVDVIRAERRSMERPEFVRAYGNVKTSSAEERLIPADAWDDVQDPTAAPTGKLSLALDVNHDRSSAALAVGDEESVEVIDHRPGTGWVVERVRSTLETWSAEMVSAEVVIDGNGPAGSVADDLEEAGVRVKRLPTPQVVAACTRMFDGVADGTVRVRPSQPLDEAAGKVAKRTMGDRFVWSRSMSSADVTPLWAVTLAWRREDRPPAIALI